MLCFFLKILFPSTCLFLILGGISISQVFVNVVDETSGGALSALMFLLLISALSLEEASLGFKG